MVVLAQEEARALCHNYIGTEHILLGLISEDAGVVFRTRPDSDSDREEHEGVAIRVLRDCDADAERIRNEVIRMLSSPDARAYASRASVSSDASMNVNPSATVRRVLMSATARALDGGRSQIGVADVLPLSPAMRRPHGCSQAWASTSRPCATRSKERLRPRTDRDVEEERAASAYRPPVLARDARSSQRSPDEAVAQVPGRTAGKVREWVRELHFSDRGAALSQQRP